MAPSKSAGAASRKNRTSSIGGASPTAMKQGKLDFTSLKRNASATTSAKEKVVGKVGVESASVKGSPAPTSIPVDEDEDDVKQSETTTPAPSPMLFSSSVAERPSKRAKTAAVPLNKPAAIDIDESSSEEEPEEPVDLDELEKSGKLNRHFGEVRAKMGGMPPIHGEKNRRSDDILRVFDLSYEYGPCIGMTRLERWERAHALGLNPPTEVRDILMTKQGKDEERLRQNVFYDEV